MAKELLMNGLEDIVRRALCFWKPFDKGRFSLILLLLVMTT